MGAAGYSLLREVWTSSNLNAEQELRPTETSRGDSENEFSESPRDREKLVFLEVPYRLRVNERNSEIR